MSGEAPAGPAAGSLDSLDARLARAELIVDEGRSELSELDDELKRRHAADRSMIGLLVVGLFAFTIGLAVLILLLAILFDMQVNKDLVEPVVTILSSILLPVVTLVIGYYFGTENRQ